MLDTPSDSTVFAYGYLSHPGPGLADFGLAAPAAPGAVGLLLGQRPHACQSL